MKDSSAPHKKRSIQLDILRAIAIILVFIGHIPYYNFGSSEIHRWIYSFHIPLFFFISGMTAVFTDYMHLSLKNKFKKRFFRLYLPFILWAIIGSLAKISPITAPYILYGSHKSLMEVTNSSLWFFPTLFLASIIFDLILYIVTKKQLRKKISILLIPLFLLTLVLPTESSINILPNCTGAPFGLTIIPMALLFMLLGLLYKEHEKQISKIISPITKPIIIIISLAVTTYFALNNTNIDYVLVAESRYGNFLYFYIAAFSGIIASVLSADILTKSPKKIKKLLLTIGTNTLVIFAFQRYPLTLISQIIEPLPTTQPINIAIIITTIVCVIPICTFISIFIKKHLPALAGIYKRPSNLA